MTESAMLSNLRCRVISRAHELKDVSRAANSGSAAPPITTGSAGCAMEPGGLEPHAKRQPQMPNQVSPVVEQTILD